MTSRRSTRIAPTTRACLIAALVLVGCGGSGSSGPAGTPTSALCTRLSATVTGHVATGAATELSGLVLSRSQPGVLWTHNDSGNLARIFAIRPTGRVLADVAVSGATNVDWEDIAIGPDPGGGEALYIGDIGDNLAGRPAIAVYRVPEPRLAGGAPSATAPAERLALDYPDRPHNAEALLVDQAAHQLLLVTKELDGPAGVYVAPIPSGAASLTLRRVAELRLGAGEPVTGGDVAANGRTIVLRTYDRAFVWPRRHGESVVAALRRPFCTAGADLLDEGQGEAIALTPDGHAFFTVPEGEDPALRRYAPLR